jgi:hypothetical protein
MAWNGSGGVGDAIKTPSKGICAPTWKKVALAGCIVAVMSVVLFLLCVGGSDESSANDKGEVRGTIEDVSFTKPVKTTEKPLKCVPSTMEGGMVSTNVDVSAESRQIPPQTNNVYVVPASTNRIFKTGLEQILNMIFNTEVGSFPGPLPRIHANEEDNLAGILLSVNKILESDDERVRNKKEQVDFAKKELIKFIKEGGDYQDFLKHYHRELVNAFRERKECQRALDEFGDQGDVDASLVRQYHKKLNERLAEKGIKQIELPEEYRDENENTETQENQK